MNDKLKALNVGTNLHDHLGVRPESHEPRDVTIVTTSLGYTANSLPEQFKGLTQ